MKYLAVICLVVGVASAGLIAPVTHLVRTPSLDSAVIKSERLGGNFAYSSVEGHSYAALTPVVRHVATPVAVSYSAPLVAPAIVAAPAYAHPYPIHYPISFAPAVIGEAPAAAPIADATPVEAAPAPADAASDTVEVEAA
ncbi:cuticle protein 16.5-like [Hetaerina americana]|uniref:cuticle protein 16.5-like n=1 Tax=Hetaerina americana TaxID=62018 RepID=UPI003A7F256A